MKESIIIEMGHQNYGGISYYFQVGQRGASGWMCRPALNRAFPQAYKRIRTAYYEAVKKNGGKKLRRQVRVKCKITLSTLEAGGSRHCALRLGDKRVRLTVHGMSLWISYRKFAQLFPKVWAKEFGCHTLDAERDMNLSVKLVRG